MATSKGLPEDLGVLAEPKEAKAPEPRPKALVAEGVGEARLVPPGVVAEWKGFLFPCDESPLPNLLEKEPLRPESVPVEGAVALPGVVRESLPELWEGRDC